MPQRCSSLQSNFGFANPVAGILMSPAFSPPRMRMATDAVRRLPSLTECIGPPTIPSPKDVSLKEKIGALATACSLFNALSCSCTRPAASTFIKCQKIADCGGSAAACFSMSSNENSLYHVNVTRLAKRLASLRICSNQNFSLGELPFTTATVLVCRVTPAGCCRKLRGSCSRPRQRCHWAWSARRYSTNAASEASSLELAVISEWSLISSGHGDCCSSSARMFLAYSLQGLNSGSSRNRVGEFGV